MRVENETGNSHRFPRQPTPNCPTRQTNFPWRGSGNYGLQNRKGRRQIPKSTERLRLLFPKNGLQKIKMLIVYTEEGNVVEIF